MPIFQQKLGGAVAKAEPPQGKTPDVTLATSKAGRNLPAAVAVGSSLAVIIVSILIFMPRLWVLIVALAVAIASWEVTKRLRQATIEVPFVPLLIGGQAIIWLTWPYGLVGAGAAFASTVVVCMIWRLLIQGFTEPPQNYLRDMSTTVLILAWIPLFAAFGALLVYPEDGSARVFCLMAGVVLSDVGGYAAGVFLGKHAMAPAISPKKSWEGFVGSLFFGVSGSCLTVTYVLDGSVWAGAVLGTVLVISGTLGDLIESQVKRDLGIKDMGTLLPGHGGIMDRMDSLLPSAVVSWIVLSALV
ncbi:MAG: phosphatidate cytidylyltransferase [Mycobacteriaceae bacterium]